MLMGIKFLAHPDSSQAATLSSWMGAAKTIWNAKCSEDKYLRAYAKKYLPIKTYAPIDQKYSQYKSDELTPWLAECPSQILRNTATNWFDTYQKFFKGICGRPQFKKKNCEMSINLTRELFRFDKDEFGNYRLFIGSKTNNIGHLSVKWHSKTFSEPNSIRIKKNKYGKFHVSFCYDKTVVDEEKLLDKKNHFKHLQTLSEEELSLKIRSYDRGVNVAVAGNDGEFYDFTPQAKKKISRLNDEIKVLQKTLKNRKKGSSRTRKTRARIAKKYEKQADIRNDFHHKTSFSIAESSATISVWEDLKIKNMTKKPKAKTEIKPDGSVKYLKNKAAAKAGLNAAILNIGWNKIYNYVEYKSHARGKISLKINPKNTSRECAECGHIQPENRSGLKFLCKNLECLHEDHADTNAARVIKKRAIKLILDSGTELSEKGVLRPKVAGPLSSDIGHRAKIRPKTLTSSGTSEEMSKKICGRKTA